MSPPCALLPLRLDSVTPMFDYSATNINRRDAEFAETLSLPYHNSPIQPENPIQLHP